MQQYIKFIGIILAAIIAYQLLNLLGSFSHTSRIRRQLKPLNELALEAEAISEVPLDTTKFEELEEAILKVPADSNGARISTGDQDLASIEAALNNLLYRMQEARKQQTRFVDDASHELRTPIAVIQGYANMLDRWGKDDPAVLEESITAIKNESENMKELIDQLLFLARGDNGRQKLTMEKIDLSEVMREVWEESSMIDSDHKYLFDGADDAFINADQAMIKQSVRIFVQNSAKYSPKGNNIKLSVKKTADSVSYVVQDEGTGIAGEEYYADDGRAAVGDRYRYIGIDKEILKLPQVRLIQGDHVIDDELELFTIGQRTHMLPFTNKRLLIKTQDGFVSDDFVHEHFLVIKDKGLTVLMSGCAHNGILSILDAYKEKYGKLPDVVISGFHLMVKREYRENELQEVRAIAEELSKYPTRFYTCHCTGVPAYEEMKKIMGDRLEYVHSGEEIIWQRY